MKKFYSILLLVIYLFNLVGYSFYYHYYINLSDKRIVQQLDNNDYRDNELVEIKVPVNLPYYSNYERYERVDGEIVLDNIHYNYVKRKIVNDTIYLMCIPNFIKTQLYKDKYSYASQGNDIPLNNKNSNTAKKNAFSDEYVSQAIKYLIATPVSVFQSGYTNYSYNLLPGHCAKQCQPPELVT